MLGLDTLICSIHNPISTLIPIIYSTPCKQCLQDIQKKKLLFNYISRLENILKLLKQLYHRYIVIHNDDLAKELYKNIWLTENIIENPNIYDDYDLFIKLSNSFDLTYKNYTNSNIISIENIEDIEQSIKISTNLLDNLFICTYSYLIALLTGIMNIVLKIQIKCVQYLI